MVQAVQGPRGEQSMLVKSVTEEVVGQLRGKDYLGEILAIRYWVTEHIRYVNDPLHVEVVKDPQRLIEEVLARGQAAGDCFPKGTLTLAEGHRLVPIEDLLIGTKIWGLDRWSTVEAKTYKGILPVDVLQLNNGSQVSLTGDHHIYVRHCPKHDDSSKRKGRCWCPISEREEIRIRVSDARPGMVLAAPARLPFGSEEMDPDRAYVEGLYVSDGWSENYRFAISGQDACPKERQKHEVQKICERLGIETRWNRKYIAVNDPEWALRMHQMGHRAPEKRILSLNMGEAAAAATLRGVMADSGKNTSGPGRTFTTTSRELAVQMRVLHKMFGVTCGRAFIENHGGLGQNPIWRLNARAKNAAISEKLLRIKAISRGVAELPCWDIQTDDHRVYLPEHDVTVSQCDDLASLIACMALQVGRVCEFVVVGFSEPGHYTHVFVRVKEPRSGKWIVCDPVAGSDERGMLDRVTTFYTKSLDEAA